MVIRQSSASVPFLCASCLLVLSVLPTSRAHPTAVTSHHRDLEPSFHPQLTPTQARALAIQYSNRLTHAQEYLQRFGYLAGDDDAEDMQRLREAITRFQDSAGIPVSGQLDDETYREMTKPRCGSVLIHRRRLRRFAQTSKWDKITPDNVLRLKWFISRYTKDMARSEIRTIVRKSFALWSTQTAIKSVPSVTLHFEEADRESDADITILWAEGDHGDAYKFDGKGNHTNVLAHTFYPTYQETGTLNGDIHLDDSEKWSGNSDGSGTAFSNVFVHEIGHALGLGHSKRSDAIMFPIYRKDVLEHVSFDLDDKCALNWNYMGHTKLCMFVWLMSEVFPRQIEKAENAYDDNLLISSMFETKQGVTATKVNKLKKKLQESTIPRCRADNDVKERFEGLLQDKLDLTYSNAHQYSSVICNFLDGLVEFREEQKEEIREEKEAVKGALERTNNDRELEEIAHNFVREHMLPMGREPPRRHRRRLSGSHHQHRHTHSSVFDRRFFDSRFFEHFFTLLVQ